MGGLSNALGASPRVRLIEALIRLGDIEVSGGQLAKEAGCYRPTTYRVLPDLVKDGLVREREESGHVVYKASVGDPTFRILAHMATALDQVEILRTEPAEVPVEAATAAIAESIRQSPWRTTAWSTLGASRMVAVA